MIKRHNFDIFDDDVISYGVSEGDGIQEEKLVGEHYIEC